MPTNVWRERLRWLAIAAGIWLVTVGVEALVHTGRLGNFSAFLGVLVGGSALLAFPVTALVLRFVKGADDEGPPPAWSVGRAALVLALTAFFAATILWDVGQFLGGLYACAWTALVGVTFGVGLARLATNPARASRAVVNVFVAGVLALPLAWGTYRALHAVSRSRTEPVATALERYHLANERYPNSLGDLVPTYLDAVPTPALFAWENAAYSFVDMGDTWELSFRTRMGARTVRGPEGVWR